MTTNSYGDNAFVPQEIMDAYVPDQLIAGGLHLVTSTVMLQAGNLARGTVLGMQSQQSTEVTANAGNTGNGTVGSVSAGAATEFGNYAILFTSATAFTVTDPEGVALPNGAVGTAYNQEGLRFTITAGGTAFVAGDGFTISNTSATGEYIESVATASDGSQVPTAILADNVNASSGPVKAPVYLMGEFNANALIYDTSWTLPALTAALRPYSIFVKSSVSAADPTNDPD